MSTTEQATEARAASIPLAALAPDVKNAILESIARGLDASRDKITAANNQTDAPQEIALATIERPKGAIEERRGPGVKAPQPEGTGLKGLVRGLWKKS